MQPRVRRSRLAAATGGAVGTLALQVAFGGVALAHGGDDGLHHHDGWMGTHAGTGGWMGSGMALLWLLALGLLLVVTAVVVYSALRGRPGGDGGGGGGPDVERAQSERGRGEDAMAVLRRRYAAGEIDEEEFERRRGRLETGGGRTGGQTDG